MLRLLASLLLTSAASAASFTVTVSHDFDGERPSETLVLPFAEVRSRLPGVLLDHVRVRRADTGAEIPSQVTNFNPDDRRALYDELVFQYSFAAGERSARFVVETTDGPVPPYARVTFARHVPERLDDFAFENDVIAHRMYGPGLDTPAAGKSRMISSGIDVWLKRVSYPIVDRWYLKGHDAYHKDTGEGLDLYSVGTGRGCGGSGIWDGSTLHTSHNWAGARVLANGPIRTVFELTYAPWKAGNLTVSEVKRFTVDAGRALHAVTSTFTIQGAPEATVALGLSTHDDKQVPGVLSGGATEGWLAFWERYPDGIELGVAVAAPGAATGTARDPLNHLLLLKAKSGEPVSYRVGAGWNRGGIADAAAWSALVAREAARAAHPVRIAFE